MSIILNRYEVERVLGKGNFGRVVLAKDLTTKKQVAIKQMSKVRFQKQPFLLKYLKGEIECMRSIKSHHVMELFQEDEDTEFKYMVCGYCNGGNLLEYQGKLPNRVIPLKKTMEIMSQVLKGLQEIHCKGYLHRDLKPQNVLVELKGDSENFRIADFGFARRQEKTTGTILGTGKFMAPEIYKEEKYGYGVDMWAIGVTIYFMLNAEYPFNPLPKQEIMTIKSKLPFSFKANVEKTARKLYENCTPQVQDLFSRIFEFEPSKRMNFHDIKTHPLFQSYFSSNDDLYTSSSIIYRKEFEGMNKPLSLDDVDEQETEMEYKSSSIVPKIKFEKQINQLEFFFQHKEFLERMSQDFRTESKYLDVSLKYALRYNLLKLYIIQAKKLRDELKQKKLPEEANSNLNWKEFFESVEYRSLVKNLSDQIEKAQGKFEDAYNDCKANIDGIYTLLPEFKDSFQRAITQKSFDDFKKSFRSATAKANTILDAASKKVSGAAASKLLELRIRVFICHVINHVFKRSDLNQNFSQYFEWKKHIKIDEDVNTFNFQSFLMWIAKEERQNVIKTISTIMKKYFG